MLFNNHTMLFSIYMISVPGYEALMICNMFHMMTQLFNIFQIMIWLFRMI